jgi:hypothetical protein
VIVVVAIGITRRTFDRVAESGRARVEPGEAATAVGDGRVTEADTGGADQLRGQLGAVGAGEADDRVAQLHRERVSRVAARVGDGRPIRLAVEADVFRPVERDVGREHPAQRRVGKRVDLVGRVDRDARHRVGVRVDAGVVADLERFGVFTGGEDAAVEPFLERRDGTFDAGAHLVFGRAVVAGQGDVLLEGHERHRSFRSRVPSIFGSGGP